MRVLLDTHAWVWWTADDTRLSRRARDVILDEAHDVLVSAATAWEIATKERLGKLDSGGMLSREFTALIAADGFEPLPITDRHGLRAGGYDVGHRDPFDRMLAAQSELESLSLVTRDTAFEEFGIETLW